MKRLLIALLMLAALSGCSEAPVFHEDQYLLREMAETIHEGSTEVSAEVPFDYAASLKSHEDDVLFTFSASGFSVSMYDIKAVAAVLDDASGTISSFGFDEEQSWNVIPFQENEGQGYISTIEMSGTLKAVPEQIGVLIQWRDSSQANTYQIYLRMDGEDLISEDEMRV